MNIKPVICILFSVFMLAFVACSDTLNSIGTSIQPDGDDINLEVDTFYVTAETVMWDSIYARTTNALVGEYDDPVFGQIKSDYLCEFFCPKTTYFSDKLTRIDSVYLKVYTHGFVGDSLSPMGLSVYMANQNLNRDFYTNVNPADYCDLTEVMGRSVFTLSEVKTWSTVDKKPLKEIRIPLDTIWGRKIYDEWMNHPSTFTNSDSLRKFIPGIYVTTTLGRGTLLNVYGTTLMMKYSYTGRNHDDTVDSTYTSGGFVLDVAPEVIQLNSVENADLDGLITPSTEKAYMKSPAGVYTELTIPLNDIANIVRKDTTVNSAVFKLTGFTDDEQFSGFDRPTNLLFINKDSIDSFFKNKDLPNGKTNFIVTYTSSSNTYNFGNISKLVNYYLDKFREENYATIPDLKYVLMPVEVETVAKTDYYGNVTYETIGISNTMAPTSAVLRINPNYMKLPIVYSKYNDRY
ncbi:DUF4270 domain-containing protein [Dysgonomonas sp. 25]|uniref:DUF4270 domain-containing protein n=1 Tax=Dysgonomonas sp. 25 TaxID=2302933 RepID=UPI0013D8C633|nr:DUF4270 domain-containing protein [Dysgonomonas sp. 25]NDV68921.1 DUF4270 domain-containing protein [Dysgonomonas sp. 25]